MSEINTPSLANQLQDLELFLKSQKGQEVGYGRALKEAIAGKNHIVEVEILKSLGDLHLQKGKLSKASVEFDKAAALYAAALQRDTDPDMGQTLEHRIDYLSKLSTHLLQGYSPQYHWLSPDYWGTADRNVLRVAELFDQWERSGRMSPRSAEDKLTEMLVTAIEKSDVHLELEVLKSLGDIYLEKGKNTSDASQFSKATAMFNKAFIGCVGPHAEQTLRHRISYTEKIRGERMVGLDRKGFYGQIDCHHLQNGESSFICNDLDSAEKHFAAALKVVHVRDPTAQQYQREVEPLCKLGEVYSKRGRQTGDGGDFVKAAALYNAAIARSNGEVLNLKAVIKKVETSFLSCTLGVHCIVSQDDTVKHRRQLKEMRDQIKLEMETIDQQLDPYVHDEDDPRVKEIETKRVQAVRQLFEDIAQQRKEFISLLIEECIGLMGPPPCKYALIGLGSQATGLVTPYSDLEFAILVEDESEEYLMYFRNLTHYLHLKVVNLGETILPALGIKSLNDFYSDDPLDSWYYDSVTPRGFAFDGAMPKASKTPLGRQGTRGHLPSELIRTPQNMVLVLQKDAQLYLKEGYHLATILRNPSLIVGDIDLIDMYMAITFEILLAEGNYRKSLSYREQALQMYRGIYGQSAAHPDISTLLNNLGAVWHYLGDYKKAASYHEQALQMGTIIYGENADHLCIATSLNDLGMDWHYLGDSRKAITYHKRALLMRRNIYGHNKEHSDIAMSLNNLGMVLHDLGDYRKAISYHEQALKMYRSIYGTPHPNIASSLNNLGSSWNRVGHYRKSKSYHKQALQMYRNIFGQSTVHPNIAMSLNNLASVCYSQGDCGRALRICQEALVMAKQIGESHPLTKTIQRNLTVINAAFCI
ncbi:PREDICTED: uncharacterized protein LOC109466244 [Branchiostoma belcheri]|uniref:Uncharacterized protein LOC109466244 n=1 Tax=Branchiostoma belcheri TaxID=7741 RepID=A0A6P4YQI1_BRABE|nr:PREDICTED: uncharacterized protein LOC109466244 [Branchiostoma belcheri]